MTENISDLVPERKFDEFSPKKFILQINHTFSYLRTKWIILILAGLAVGLIYVAFSFSKKPKYTAEFSFALDEGAVKSTPNSLTALTEELGFDPGYEAGGVFSSMTNILELMRSRLIIEKTLMRTDTLFRKPILFANFFLDSLGYRQKWMDGSPYYNIDFLNKKASREERIYRNGIINNIYGIITSKFVEIDRKGKGSTLILVTLTSENEAFSKDFLEALIDEVSKLYVEIKTHRAKLHLDFVQKRADSVRNAYSQALYGRAAFTDANINPNQQIAVVPGEKKQTDVQILRDNYIGLVKSLESAKTSLMQDTPLFQYLDVPVLPLKVTGNNLLFKFIIFFIIGVMLASILLIAARIYHIILQNDR